jgi:mannose-1-phosphate guanylyltransferase
MIALIMAGGSGTRFWPLSRASLPKQYLRILGDKSMLQLTFERLETLVPPEKVYVVTSSSQAILVKEHLPELPPENIIIEPFGMNTAPCIALSVEYLSALYNENETMVVLPADHIIKDTDTFIAALKKAETAAQKGMLITFGIVPDYPATGYGYIEKGEELEEGIFSVKQFKEKPDLDTAKEFLRQGTFFWNSGIFCWTLSSIHKALKEFLPETLTLAEEVLQLKQSFASEEAIAAVYRKMSRIPIDIGVMEKARFRAVIPVSFGWSDVGSWKALADISPKDENQNTFKVDGFALNARDDYVYSDKFVALIGVDGLCIIETDDALLVTSKDQSEKVKEVVEYLQRMHKDNLL